jgi:hypothetical protein
VTSRVSLDTLRARHARCTSQLTADVVESVPSLADDPEREAVMAEMIGTALTVLLETLRSTRPAPCCPDRLPSSPVRRSRNGSTPPTTRRRCEPRTGLRSGGREPSARVTPR